MSRGCAPAMGGSPTGMITIRRTHSVDCAVENLAFHVDAMNRSSVVHELSLRSGWETRLSSTSLKPCNASVHGDLRTLSPPSTDAMTTDEKLYSMTDNDQSVQQVEAGDIPSTVLLLEVGTEAR